MIKSDEMIKRNRYKLGRLTWALLISILTLVSVADAADVITNGTFNSDASGWTYSVGSQTAGDTAWDATVFGNASGSIMGATEINRRRQYEWYMAQSLGNVNASDDVFLSFWWYKTSISSNADRCNVKVRLVRPAGDTVDVWTDSQIPSPGSPLSGNVTASNVSSQFNTNGTYTILLYGDLATSMDKKAQVQNNFDDIIVDVQGAANNAPTVSTGATTPTPATVDRTGSNTYNPDDAQTLGLYDLYFEVTDGTDNLIDNFTVNVDELEINETLPAIAPTLTPGTTLVSASPVNRLEANTPIISATFSDGNSPALSSFLTTSKIREPNNSTELILVNGLTDGYVSNDNQPEINEVISNLTPVIVAGATTVAPGSIDRVGAITTTFSVPFTDGDQPGINEFFVKIQASAPYFQGVTTIADSLKHGQGGLTITDGGGGSYTASISWDPPDNAVTGYWDLQAIVANQISSATDVYDANQNELLITNGGENSPPIVATDAVFASPAGIERIGANPTTISATFTDGDAPAASTFRVSFKLREPDDVGVITLADNLAHGAGGVTISDLGGGIYTASIDWDPADGQTIGFYDLYFHVTDQEDTSYDDYMNNLDELQVYDAISNNAPTLTAGNSSVLPDSVNRIGSEFTMIQTAFTDVDVPGIGAFTITIKVRSAVSTEYTLVNAAAHDEQGLRVLHTGGGTYEASVLWDPPDAQLVGVYDLYFYVEDASAASAIDDYANNLDELTITSSAILGDGYLLKRTNDANNCGGTASACHNIADHQTQNCVVCHAPHSTKNIYLVKETITTPNSGDQAVLFKTKTGVLGDPTSGGMADSTDGVWNGVCEVCHTTTGHHRNDGSQPGPNHNDATDCTGCHPHSEGFAVSGGGESPGGSACTCHGPIFTSMDSASVLHRHILANNNADYSPGVEGMYATKNCLACHVDHDIFRPDLNIGFGQRGRNLRVDWAIDPVQGNSTDLTNSDYSSSGNGGICLSCHSGPSCDGCHSAHSPERPGTGYTAQGSFSHEFIDKAGFAAATTTHNYNVPSTFATDGSTFNANCTKCHNDDQSKSYQSSTYKFSLHGSTFDNILDSTGIASATDPIEEELCFKCHSTTSNPNAGSNLDFFGVKSITNQDALDIEASFSRTYTHPTTLYSGRHSLADSALSLADGNRHAECGDCHNVHAAKAGTHDGSSALASNALTGTWGAKPDIWPAAPTPTDNANLFAAPVSFTRVEDATLTEWMICFKCHSNYTTLPGGGRNLAEEINPNYPSSHAIVQAGDNAFCNSTTMNEPWATNKINYCSDCHRSDNAADPEGPHGSNSEHLLVATIVSNSSVGTPLCDVCHLSSVYWTGSATPSDFNDHPSSKDRHKGAPGCFSCHMWDYSSTAGLGLPTDDWPGGFNNAASLAPPIKIWIHGQNRKWVYNEQDGTNSPMADPVENFIDGYMADMDHSANRCWTETCKTHSDKSY